MQMQLTTSPDKYARGRLIVNRTRKRAKPFRKLVIAQSHKIIDVVARKMQKIYHKTIKDTNNQRQQILSGWKQSKPFS